MMQSPPTAQGLYDPQFEHDACGIGAVVDIAGSEEPQDRRLCQADPLEPATPRGVRGRRIDGRRGGNPHANPARVLRRRGRSPEVRIARRRTVRRRHPLPAPRRGRPRHLRRGPGPGAGERGPGSAGLARRALRQPHLGRDRPQRRTGHPPDLRRRQGLERRAARTAAVSRPQAGRAEGAGRSGHHARRLLHPLAFLQDDRLQGDVPGAAALRLLSRPGRPRHDDGLGGGPPAVQHQHLPKLAVGAAFPHDRPQRRNQHPARQPQPAEGLREDHGLSGLGQGPFGPLSHRRAGRKRFGLLRQLHGTAGPRRPLGAARADDDDPRGLRAGLPHFARQAGLLRVPRRDPRAVGRTGGDGLHRRPAGGRHAWTATACVPAATSSPPRAWWCWPAKWA